MKSRLALRWTAGPGMFVALTLVGTTAAWAAGPSSPSLHQHDQHILATNSSFDQDFGTCGVAQDANEDVWVFVWPGGSNAVGTISAVQIGWDTDGNGTADSFQSLADATAGEDNGTPKLAFVTPAGWRLESGTSTISGQTSTFGSEAFPQGSFNLTHTCPGTSTTPTPPSSAPPSSKPPTSAPVTSAVPTTPVPGESTPPVRTTAPGTTAPPSDDDLPITGAALTGLILTGLALAVAGAVMLVVLRRRRDAAAS